MTRDTQVLISILFPMIIPLLATIGPSVTGGDVPVASFMAVFMAGVMGAWMVIHGMTRLQFGSGGLEATLPIRERDRVGPRLWLAAVLPAIGAIVPALTLVPFGSPEQGRVLVQAVAVLVVGPAGLLLKLGLFGAVGTGANPIVLDEVRTRARGWKWAAVVALLVVLTVGIIVGHGALRGALAAEHGVVVADLVFLAGVAVLAGADVVLTHRMFP